MPTMPSLSVPGWLLCSTSAKSTVAVSAAVPSSVTIAVFLPVRYPLSDAVTTNVSVLFGVILSTNSYSPLTSVTSVLPATVTVAPAKTAPLFASVTLPVMPTMPSLYVPG